MSDSVSGCTSLPVCAAPQGHRPLARRRVPQRGARRMRPPCGEEYAQTERPPTHSRTHTHTHRFFRSHLAQAIFVQASRLASPAPLERSSPIVSWERPVFRRAPGASAQPSVGRGSASVCPRVSAPILGRSCRQVRCGRWLLQLLRAENPVGAGCYAGRVVRRELQRRKHRATASKTARELAKKTSDRIPQRRSLRAAGRG